MKKDYSKIFDKIIKETKDYIINNNLKSMILGISGGIDSTVVAAICYEVSERTGIPLIGRSLPTMYNKFEETSTADLVGKAFCNDYKDTPITYAYEAFLDLLDDTEEHTALSRGNIQARLRMIYLYNLASIHKGLVMDTDNLTENNLGYFTIHGDVGDFNPIGGLWKTEVFKLAEYLIDFYRMTDQIDRGIAMFNSWSLKPTAGLGITDNDLEEIGAESYDQVDDVLKVILAWKMITVPTKYSFDNFMESDFISELTHIPEEIIKDVAKRHFASEFKRNKLPIKVKL
jgi:NAD+ synthetase